jgi:fatty acyl-CoA reductase
MQVLGKDLFNTLREKRGLAGFQKLIKEKIVPVAGDVGTRDFGLDSSRLEDLCEEIDVIIHGAATTSFYERYKNCATTYHKYLLRLIISIYTSIK